MSNEIQIFNFVSDEQFRRMLESDYSEIHRCISADCPKSAIVISGSVVECLALYAINALGLWPSNKGNLLEANLSALIIQLQRSGVISEKSRDLSSVIRYYRNLIHPGRVIRLEEKIDKNSAIIAASLVNIISNEIEGAFIKRHGLTAEQFTHKLRIDPSAANIAANHHLNRMSEPERAKLMTRIIPIEIVKMDNDLTRYDDDYHAGRFANAIEKVFAMLCKDDKVLPEFARLYVDTLRNESEDVINAFDGKLPHGEILRHLEDGDRMLVIDHWKSRLPGPGMQYHVVTLVLAAAVSVRNRLTGCQ